MVPSGVIADHLRPKIPQQGWPYRMGRLETVIDQLSESANQADLTSRFATSHETRLYNADLARELRGIIAALKNELDRREGRPLAEAISRQRVPPLIEVKRTFLCTVMDTKAIDENTGPYACRPVQ